MTTREREAKALLGLSGLLVKHKQGLDPLDEEVLKQIRRKRESDCCAAWMNGFWTCMFLMIGLLCLVLFNPLGVGR